MKVAKLQNYSCTK